MQHSPVTVCVRCVFFECIWFILFCESFRALGTSESVLCSQPLFVAHSVAHWERGIFYSESKNTVPFNNTRSSLLLLRGCFCAGDGSETESRLQQTKKADTFVHRPNKQSDRIDVAGCLLLD